MTTLSVSPHPASNDTTPCLTAQSVLVNHPLCQQLPPTTLGFSVLTAEPLWAGATSPHCWTEQVLKNKALPQPGSQENGLKWT